MRNMDIKVNDIIATILINFICCAYTEHILPCNISDWHNCPGNNQICNEILHQCLCVEGYVRSGDDCVSDSDSSSSHDATAAVVSIFTIALVIVGLVLVIKKYNLIEYIHQKINLRRNNDIMYEDVMIGQDDPPLVP